MKWRECESAREGVREKKKIKKEEKGIICPTSLIACSKPVISCK
jgi:hypothetical protein